MLTYLKYKWWERKEERRVQNYYQAYPAFRDLDQALKKSYRFDNPYRTSRRYLEARGAPDVHLYGETPLTTLNQIGEQCHLQPTDHFLDLGCGRGRGALFIASRFGCLSTGVEQIPEFVAKARQLNAPRVTFEQGDYFCADLSRATVIYLYGTCLSDKEIEHITKRFFSLKKGTKILTVSYSLGELILKNAFTAPFPWGETEVYVQEVP